jgi:glycosyltransferase involved in cell wall biosynthesis
VRPHALAANSAFVAQRIRRVWGRDARVIHPPVDTDRFTMRERKEDFFVCASRLHYYKRVDVIVSAFASLPDRRLFVIGDGPERQRLESMAGDNVTFLGYQSDEILRDHLQRASAFLFAAEEDFGILPVEAQACGTPVIAFGKGGALETVREMGKPAATGLFFQRQQADDVATAVRSFLANRAQFSARNCRAHALTFGASRFRDELRSFVERSIHAVTAATRSPAS